MLYKYPNNTPWVTIIWQREVRLGVFENQSHQVDTCYFDNKIYSLDSVSLLKEHILYGKFWVKPKQMCKEELTCAN